MFIALSEDVESPPGFAFPFFWVWIPSRQQSSNLLGPPRDRFSLAEIDERDLFSSL